MAEFEPVSEHISRLEVTWHVFGPITVPVSMWLVREHNGWTLVDSGPPEAADQLVAAIARATGGQGPLRVLLTHAHYDHAGGLEALRDAWNPSLLCHREEVPFVTGGLFHSQIRSRRLAFWIGRYLMKEGLWALPVSRDLERGESAAGMAVIHLPGHTPGQVGFLHPSDRAFICGDAVLNLNDRLASPPPIYTPDSKAARASMHRLAELDFSHLLPSHGPPIYDRGRQAMLDFLNQSDSGPELRHW
jgi:glyoxylase-like metal-dependent hydrolase (beta-lactamase superfamily II)